ncbi:MAG: GntR family transcriptional regulator [Acidobacteriota bacterium]
MLLQLTDLSDEPLHSQLSRQVRAKILAGDLADGESLPSIRGLAREARVSVITVQRAYEDLEREGLIVARRGKGFFVRAMAEEAKERMAQERFTHALRPVIDEGRAEGLDDPVIRAIFEEVLAPAPGDGDKA